MSPIEISSTGRSRSLCTTSRTASGETGPSYGQPKAVETLYDSGVTRGVLALHFHDTRGTGLANVYAGLECGITTYDSSAGGLGGCPYAPGAAGNLATEDLIYLLEGLGIETGVSLRKVVDASRFLAGALGRRPPGRYLAAVWGAADVIGGQQ